MATVDSEEKVGSSTDILYKGSLTSTSSDEHPSKESSILRYEPEDSPKMKLYKEGLYDPGTGEICTDYVAMSDSAVLNHPYYEYPGVKDPGIVKTLCFPEEDKVYDLDGQELYLDLCKEMNVTPVRLFYRGLKQNIINLRYYGVSPKGVKAMCLALAYNKTVSELDLTSNFLEDQDSCFHLGELLGFRSALQNIILSGCRIGCKGMKKLVVYLHTRHLKLFDLTGNNITDEGFTYLAESIEKGAVIRCLKLRNNDLSSDSLLLLAEVLAYNDTVTHLDLSWNRFYKLKGPTALFRRLGNSQVLVELDMSWTGLSIIAELRNLLGIETLKVLNLSNNRLPSLAARTIGRALHLAQILERLDLSCNPFSQEDALFILIKMRQEKVALKELRMDHIIVNKEFAEELKNILKLTFRNNTIITHGDVLRNYTLPESDIKIITLRRFVMSTKKKRKIKLDILSYFLELNKTRTNIDPSELVRTLRIYDAPVNDELIAALPMLFPGPKNDNGSRTINLITLVDYIHRLWPNKKPPPTPPHTPTPKPTPPASFAKGKDKKKK